MPARFPRRLFLAAAILAPLLIALPIGLAGGWWLREQWISPQQSADRVLLEKVRSVAASHFPNPDSNPPAPRALDGFDPSKSDCLIEWTWSNGFAGTRNTLALAGSGELRLRKFRQRDGERTVHDRLLRTMPAEECHAFFADVLTSGILDHSAAAIQVKKAVSESRALIAVDDGTDASLRIVVPDFEIERTISVYEIDAELRSHPEIVEFRIFKALEDRFVALAPRE